MWFERDNGAGDRGYGPEVLDAGWTPPLPEQPARHGPCLPPADLSSQIAEFLRRFYANQSC